jgi:transcriptional regulator with XRE-family HTH domain
MSIDLYTYVKRQLLATPRDQWPAIAKAANIGNSTLQKYAYGVIKSPGYAPIQALANVLMTGVADKAA